MQSLGRALIMVLMIPLVAYAGASVTENERVKCELKDGVFICTFKDTGERLRLSWDGPTMGNQDGNAPSC